MCWTDEKQTNHLEQAGWTDYSTLSMVKKDLVWSALGRKATDAGLTSMEEVFRPYSPPP